MIDGDNASGWVVQDGIGLAASRRMTLSPSSGYPGIDITATITGMPASKSHDIQWDGVKIASFTTNSSGGATVKFKAPASFEGTHELRAICGVARAYKNFDITSRVALAPKSGAVVQPSRRL